MAAPFIVSGLAAAQSHDQGHRKPHVSLPHSSDTSCNSVRRLTVLYPSLVLSFQALKSKTDMSKESSHLLHGKGQGSDEAQPSAEGRGLFPPEGLPCWAGRRQQERCFSMRFTWLSSPSRDATTVTTATMVQGAHTVLLRGKTPALRRADLESPVEWRVQRGGVDHIVISC